MPYLTTRKNLKLQLSPGLVASYTTSSQETEWVYSGTQNAHIYLLTYLLAYFPRTQTNRGLTLPTREKRTGMHPRLILYTRTSETYLFFQTDYALLFYRPIAFTRFDCAFQI